MSVRSGRIAVFDSGLGGLSVLKHLRLLLPTADFTYFADQARAPYGDREADDVLEFSREIVRHLSKDPTAAIVVACNTASSVALEPLRSDFPATPIVGMEPAVKPAASATKSGIIGVLATTRTVESQRLAGLIDTYAPSIEVVTQACPGLVELVEDGLVASEHTRNVVRSYVRPLVDRGVDTIVLGCTHFSFLEPVIQAAAGAGVTIVDPAEAVARRAASLVSLSHGSAGVHFETTGDPVRFRRQLSELLGTVEPTYRVDTTSLAAP